MPPACVITRYHQLKGILSSASSASLLQAPPPAAVARCRRPPAPSLLLPPATPCCPRPSRLMPCLCCSFYGGLFGLAAQRGQGWQQAGRPATAAAL